jgi:hypothetical protein
MVFATNDQDPQRFVKELWAQAEMVWTAILVRGRCRDEDWKWCMG